VTSRRPAGPAAGRLGAWWEFLRELWIQVGKDQISFAAAAVAFYAWLSLFPLMLVAIAGLGVWLSSAEAMQQTLDLLSHSLPAFTATGMDFAPLLKSIADSRGKAGLLGGLLLLWVGSQVVVALEVALNRVFGAAERRNWISVRLGAIAFVLVAGALGLAVILSGVVVSIFVTVAVARAAYWVCSLLLTALLFSLAYILLPRKDVPFVPALIGGLVTAVLWTIVNSLLVVYFSDFTNFASVYGPLAGTVAVLLACYYLALVTLVGAEVTAILTARRQS